MGDDVVQDFLEEGRIVLSVKGETGHGFHGFAQKARIEPTVTGHDALDTAVFPNEGIALAHQLVVERGDGADFLHRGGELAFERGGVHRLAGGGGEHQAVAGLHLRLEGAGDPEVFAAVVPAAHLIRIGDALVPHGVEFEGRCGGAELQVEVREAFIHVECGAVLDRFVVRTGRTVLSGKGVKVAEGQERLEFHLHLGGSVHQLVLDEELVLIGTQDKGLAEHDFADLVGDGGDGIRIEVNDVLVTAGFIDVSIAMDTQVEPLSAEGEALIEGTQQDVPVSVELFYRNGQKAMVAPRIAGDDGRVAVRTGLVRQDNLSLERILEIDEFRLVEFQKSHKYVFILASIP